ncbi:hypothetical protein [Leptotrichia sp. oral taxon 223]|uniref:hypothetical protein n=1 Tax=Leptotrichia sp. oral taxon 223 TaxID=712363 RepID=UPI0015B90BC0|nr:hypothetical protein [Leptotrichia sp. oral taxon 223]NWO19410.1 hypothetical protein [Leptotrichia sp. oral taxon 223]
MKKLLLIFCIIFLSLIGILKIQKFLQKQYFLSKLDKKYFITIVDEKIKDPDKRKNKIIGYDGKEKKVYANTEKIDSILSFEDKKIFYYKEFGTSKREIVEYDLKNKKIINSFPFHNTDYSLKNMIKVDDNLYFSKDFYFIGSEIENELYEYNLKTKNIRKILNYNGEGLPLIMKERIYYSKDAKIYIFDKNTKEIKYLCEGIKPFAYDNNYLYYMDKQNNLIKISEKNNQKEKLYTLGSDIKIGGKPEKITDDLYLFVKLVPKFIKIEFDVDDTELELVDIKKNKKINLKDLYYRNNFFEKEQIEENILFTNTTFMFIDKK